jgi:hypothetical protein
MAGYMLWVYNTHSIAQDSSSCTHIHSAAGRGGRLGHDNKGLNENDLRCLGTGNRFQEVKFNKLPGGEVLGLLLLLGVHETNAQPPQNFHKPHPCVVIFSLHSLAMSVTITLVMERKYMRRTPGLESLSSPTGRPQARGRREDRPTHPSIYCSIQLTSPTICTTNTTTTLFCDAFDSLWRATSTLPEGRGAGWHPQSPQGVASTRSLEMKSLGSRGKQATAVPYTRVVAILSPCGLVILA